MHLHREIIVNSGTLILQRPTIVIAGAFNPVIFNPAWMAYHLYDKEEGVQTPAEHVQIMAPARQSITFIDNIGVSARKQRVEIFIANMADESRQRAEAIAAQVVQKLPHTPFAGFGVNFQINCKDPDEELTGLFDTREGLESYNKIASREAVVAFQPAANKKIIIKRRLQDDEVDISFNYHTDASSPEEMIESLKGVVAKSYEDCVGVLEKFYRTKVDQCLAFDDDGPYNLEEAE